jgi:hypothetical protein
MRKKFAGLRTMTKPIVALIVLLPIALAAQQTDLSPMMKQPRPAASQPQDPSSDAIGTSSTAPSDSQAVNPPSQQTSTQSSPPTSTPPTKEKGTNKPIRPASEGSMVGYVDDAIVASQIRFRFDAGFHDNAPDRAEFFYAQYSGINGP